MQHWVHNCIRNERRHYKQKKRRFTWSLSCITVFIDAIRRQLHLAIVHFPEHGATAAAMHTQRRSHALPPYECIRSQTAACAGI
jgi:hypothetical protein